MVKQVSSWFCRFILLSFSFLLFSESYGQTTLRARRALVSVDGAAVYEKPDFDSSVLGYLSMSEAVVASQRTFNGRGGIGLFFAIRTSKGVRGFIADTDLIAADTKRPMSPLLRDRAPVDLKKESQAPNTDMFGEKEPLYFSRFLGGTIGKKGYSVKHNGRTYSSDLLFFGIRGTGPGTLFDGPPLDFNLAISIDSPQFYEEFAQNKPNGFLVYSDLLLQLPAWENDKQLIYYGLGLMATYSSYRVQLNDRFSDANQFRLGAEVGLGYAHRIFKSHLVRVDYKYHFERFQNTSFWLSIMTEY